MDDSDFDMNEINNIQTSTTNHQETTAPSKSPNKTTKSTESPSTSAPPQQRPTQRSKSNDMNDGETGTSGGTDLGLNFDQLGGNFDNFDSTNFDFDAENLDGFDPLDFNMDSFQDDFSMVQIESIMAGSSGGVGGHGQDEDANDQNGENGHHANNTQSTTASSRNIKSLEKLGLLDGNNNDNRSNSRQIDTSNTNTNLNDTKFTGFDAITATNKAIHNNDSGGIVGQSRIGEIGQNNSSKSGLNGQNAQSSTQSSALASQRLNSRLRPLDSNTSTATKSRLDDVLSGSGNRKSTKGLKTLQPLRQTFVDDNLTYDDYLQYHHTSHSAQTQIFNQEDEGDDEEGQFSVSFGNFDQNFDQNGMGTIGEEEDAKDGDFITSFDNFNAKKPTATHQTPLTMLDSVDSKSVSRVQPYSTPQSTQSAQSTPLGTPTAAKLTNLYNRSRLYDFPHPFDTPSTFSLSGGRDNDQGQNYGLSGQHQNKPRRPFQPMTPSSSLSNYSSQYSQQYSQYGNKWAPEQVGIPTNYTQHYSNGQNGHHSGPINTAPSFPLLDDSISTFSPYHEEFLQYNLWGLGSNVLHPKLLKPLYQTCLRLHSAPFLTNPKYSTIQNWSQYALRHDIEVVNDQIQFAAIPGLEEPSMKLYSILNSAIKQRANSHSLVLGGPDDLPLLCVGSVLSHILYQKDPFKLNAVIIHLSGYLNTNDTIAIKSLCLQLCEQLGISCNLDMENSDFHDFAQFVTILFRQISTLDVVEINSHDSKYNLYEPQIGNGGNQIMGQNGSNLGQASKLQALPIIIILEGFDHFAQTGVSIDDNTNKGVNRQSFLYLLGDLAQTNQAWLHIIGIANSPTAYDFLEKRVKSRLPMQNIFLHNSLYQPMPTIKPPKQRKNNNKGHGDHDEEDSDADLGPLGPQTVDIFQNFQQTLDRLRLILFKFLALPCDPIDNTKVLRDRKNEELENNKGGAGAISNNVSNKENSAKNNNKNSEKPRNNTQPQSLSLKSLANNSSISSKQTPSSYYDGTIELVNLPLVPKCWSTIDLSRDFTLPNWTQTYYYNISLLATLQSEIVTENVLTPIVYGGLPLAKILSVVSKIITNLTNFPTLLTPNIPPVLQYYTQYCTQVDQKRKDRYEKYGLLMGKKKKDVGQSGRNDGKSVDLNGQNAMTDGDEIDPKSFKSPDKSASKLGLLPTSPLLQGGKISRITSPLLGNSQTKKPPQITSPLLGSLGQNNSSKLFTSKSRSTFDGMNSTSAQTDGVDEGDVKRPARQSRLSSIGNAYSEQVQQNHQLTNQTHSFKTSNIQSPSIKSPPNVKNERTGVKTEDGVSFFDIKAKKRSSPTDDNDNSNPLLPTSPQPFKNTGKPNSKRKHRYLSDLELVSVRSHYKYLSSWRGTSSIAPVLVCPWDLVAAYFHVMKQVSDYDTTYCELHNLLFSKPHIVSIQMLPQNVQLQLIGKGLGDDDDEGVGDAGTGNKNTTTATNNITTNANNKTLNHNNNNRPNPTTQVPSQLIIDLGFVGSLLRYFQSNLTLESFNIHIDARYEHDNNLLMTYLNKVAGEQKNFLLLYPKSTTSTLNNPSKPAVGKDFKATNQQINYFPQTLHYFTPQSNVQPSSKLQIVSFCLEPDAEKVKIAHDQYQDYRKSQTKQRIALESKNSMLQTPTKDKKVVRREDLQTIFKFYLKSWSNSNLLIPAIPTVNNDAIDIILPTYVNSNPGLDEEGSSTPRSGPSTPTKSAPSTPTHPHNRSRIVPLHSTPQSSRQSSQFSRQMGTPSSSFSVSGVKIITIMVFCPTTFLATAPQRNSAPPPSNPPPPPLPSYLP